MPRVQITDGRVIEFPDGMSQDAMAKALQSLPPLEQQPSASASAQPDTAGPLAGLGRAFAGARDAASGALNWVDTVGGLMKTPQRMQKEGKLVAPGVGTDPQSLVPQTGGQLLSGAANLIPGMGPLAAGARLATAGGLGAAGNALTGHDPSGGAGEALLGQGLGEGVSGALAGGKKILQGRQDLKNYESLKARNKAMTEALTFLDKQGYEKDVSAARNKYAEDVRQVRNANQADRTDYQNKVQGVRDADAARIRQEKLAFRDKVAADEAAYNAKAQTDATAYSAQKSLHAEDAARSLVDDFKTAHPALKGIPSTYEGLTNIVYGKGQSLVSEAFDKSLTDVVAKGAGKVVPLPLEDAKALGFKNMRTHKIAPSGRGVEPVESVDVDAGELAQRLPGSWKKNPMAYRRGVSALDEAGIGDPVAREQYSKFQGLVDYLDKVKALTPTGLATKNIEKGLYDLKKINTLRKRGIGDALEGPMQVARGGPLAPQKPEPFQAPPFIPGARTPLPQAPQPLPLPQRTEMPQRPQRIPPPEPQDPRSQFTGPAIGGSIGGLLGYLGGSAMGHPYLGAHAGAGLGAAAGKTLAPKGIAIGKLDPATLQMLSQYPGLVAAIARQGLQQ